MASVGKHVRRLRKKHQVRKDTVGGTVVLKCQCGWKGWDRFGDPIPSEWDQWKAYYKHL